MRPIFINGRFLSQPVTGAQRYSLQLLEELDLLLEKIASDRPRVTLLVPRGTRDAPKYQHLAVVPAGRLSGHLWEQLELPFYARGGLLFTPSGGAPVIHPRNIITIHDAAVIAAPQGYSFGFGAWYRMLYRALCRSSLHVFTVSYFSKAELVKWYGADPEKVSVTYLGSEHALRPPPEPAVLTRNKLRPRGYVFAVGSSNANKNLAGLLCALPRLAGSGLQVAIAGHKDVRVFGKREALNGVHDLGYVNESELRTLYENAACFVFPSFYEGFGLPPLEALALGCPVVVSQANSLAEIFSEVAFLCDPRDPADIADKIVKASKEPEKKRVLYPEFAKAYCWSLCAEMTWGKIAAFANESPRS